MLMDFLGALKETTVAEVRLLRKIKIPERAK
jgi:hypothetical protein